MTANTRSEHTLLTRQHRCLQGVCKCSSAGISHFVVAEVQFGECGIRLLICHNTGANAQVAARLLSHTTAPAWSKFCLQRNAFEDACDRASCLPRQGSNLSYSRVPMPAAFHITSGAQWTRNCAGRWRQCVEEMTRWSNDPPLGAKHAIVQRDSRFPRAIHLSACGGWRRITSIKTYTNVKNIGRSANCPCVRCCVRVSGCSWPHPRTATN